MATVIGHVGWSTLAGSRTMVFIQPLRGLRKRLEWVQNDEIWNRISPTKLNSSEKGNLPPARPRSRWEARLQIY